MGGPRSRARPRALGAQAEVHLALEVAAVGRSLLGRLARLEEVRAARTDRADRAGQPRRVVGGVEDHDLDAAARLVLAARREGVVLAAPHEAATAERLEARGVDLRAGELHVLDVERL